MPALRKSAPPMRLLVTPRLGSVWTRTESYTRRASPSLTWTAVTTAGAQSMEGPALRNYVSRSVVGGGEIKILSEIFKDKLSLIRFTSDVML